MLKAIKSFFAALVIVLELFRRSKDEQIGERRVLLEQSEDENEKWKNRREVNQDVDDLGASALERELRAAAETRRR